MAAPDITELQKTSGQHYVTVDGNEVMVFDNNNRDQQTEIRSYALELCALRMNLIKEASCATH